MGAPHFTKCMILPEEGLEQPDRDPATDKQVVTKLRFAVTQTQQLERVMQQIVQRRSVPRGSHLRQLVFVFTTTTKWAVRSASL
jgi:hypothetical protein